MINEYRTLTSRRHSRVKILMVKHTNGERKMPEETEEKFNLLSFCEEAVSLLIMAYLFIVFSFYPFYMQNGYVEIGDAKFSFYKEITLGGFALIVPLAVISMLLRYRETKSIVRYKSLSVTDCAFLFYGVAVVLSYFFSEFKQEAFWGEKGWYMGLATQLLFILSYFLVSRFWEYEEKLLLAFLAASAGIFLLGLLNRFSVYPIVIEGANREFISTMGNINWYCGYFAVLFPIGFVWYWITDKKWIKAAGAFYVLLGIATGVSQGSSSAFIVIPALYLLLFCLSFRSLKRMKSLFELAFLFCAACQALRIWRLYLPESFDYYDGSLSDWITMSRATLYAMVPLAVVYLLMLLAEKKKHMDITRYKMLRQIILLVLIIAAGVYVMLLIFNTRARDGIRFMGGQQILIFSEYWGSSRGGTWSAGIGVFQEMPGLRKLVGAGPDCFASYLYTLPDVTEKVMDQFGTSRLTNAHNEWLTVLVNNGILGLIGYAGIFLSVWLRFIYRAEKVTAELKNKLLDDSRQLLLYAFAASAIAYTAHNIVSFQQILSTPFIFLLLGMGERLMKKKRENP